MRIAAILASLAILGGVGYFAKRELGRPADTPVPTVPTPEVAPLPTFAAPPVKGPANDVQTAPTVPLPSAMTTPPVSPGAGKGSPGAAHDTRPGAKATKNVPTPSTYGGSTGVPSPTKTSPARPTEPPAYDTFSVGKAVKVNISPSQARVFLDGRYIGISDDWDDSGGGALVTFSEGQ